MEYFFYKILCDIINHYIVAPTSTPLKTFRLCVAITTHDICNPLMVVNKILPTSSAETVKKKLNIEMTTTYDFHSKEAFRHGKNGG